MDVRAMLDNIDERLWRIFGAFRTCLPARRELQEIKVPAGNGTSRALVLAPHPDDESLALGGTLLRHAREHDLIKIVVMTDGSACTASQANNDISLIRRGEIERISADLGNAQLELWPCRDQHLSSFEDGARRLGQIISDFKPHIIYTPICLDRHPDHLAANRILADAVLGGKVDDCEVRAYEGIFPTTWMFCNTYVDISDVTREKRELLTHYKSQRNMINFEGVLSYNKKSSFLFHVGEKKAIEVYLRCSARLYGECVRQIEPGAFPWLAPISGRQPMQFFAYCWNTLLTAAKARLIRKCICRR